MFAAQTGHYSMEYLSKQISYQSVSERVRGRVRERVGVFVCVCIHVFWVKQAMLKLNLMMDQSYIWPQADLVQHHRVVSTLDKVSSSLCEVEF